MGRLRGIGANWRTCPATGQRVGFLSEVPSQCRSQIPQGLHVEFMVDTRAFTGLLGSCVNSRVCGCKFAKAPRPYPHTPKPHVMESIRTPRKRGFWSVLQIAADYGHPCKSVRGRAAGQTPWQEYPDLKMKPRSGITEEEWDYFLHIEDAERLWDVRISHVWICLWMLNDKVETNQGQRHQSWCQLA